MAAQRLAVFLPVDTPEDRVALVDLLGATTGSVRPIAVPEQGMGKIRGWKGSTELVLGVTTPRGSKLLLARAARLLETPSGRAEVLVELGGLVAGGASTLVRTYFEDALRTIEAQSVHVGAPPLRVADRQADAWHHLIDELRLLEIEGVDTIAFLRIGGVQLTEDHVEIHAQTYAPGANIAAKQATLLRILNERGSEIGLEELTEELVISIPPTSGTIRLQASGAMRGEVSTHVVGEPTRESGPRVPAATSKTPSHSTTPMAVRQLLDFGEHGLGADKLKLAEFAQRLAAVAGPDPVLSMAEARGFFQTGDMQRAAEVLRGISDSERRPEAEGMLIVCELALGEVDLEVSRFERAAFDDHLFASLIHAVEQLPTGSVDAAVDVLTQVLSAPRAAAIASRVGPQLGTGPALPRIARRIAKASPSDAIALLERAAASADLPTDALETLVDLRLATEQAGLGDAVAVLVDRHIGSGRIADAVSVVERSAPVMYPLDATVTANRVLAVLGSAGRELDDDELLYAMALTGVVERAARALRPIDLAEAIGAVAAARSALSPIPAELEMVLAPVESELFEAWEGTEEHRAALAELEQSLVPAIRDRWHTKRFLIVGGRRPLWWEPLRADLGLSVKSDWMTAEAGRRPSMAQLKAAVGSGRVDLVVIITDYIAHATSEIKEFARDCDVPVAEARSGRLSLLLALRATD